MCHNDLINKPGTTYAPKRTQHDPIRPPKPNRKPINSHTLAPKILHDTNELAIALRDTVTNSKHSGNCNSPTDPVHNKHSGNCNLLAFSLQQICTTFDCFFFCVSG